MKIIRIIIIIFSLYIVIACSHTQSKQIDSKPIDTIKIVNEKTIIKKIGKPDENPDKKNINKSLEKPIIKKVDISELKDLKPCENIAKEILTTSKRYKEITKGLNEGIKKNGGQSFGISLEGSPNPRPDKAWGYSKTYDFTIFEMYVDRQLNTARFSFNPNTGLLYEYDAVHDQLKPIDFDKKLLLKYDSQCK
jgi:hypothetical protein